MSDLRDSILIVDDEFLIAQMLTYYVEDMGRTVCGTAATADEAIVLAQEHRPAIVLMDMRLRGAKDGVDAALAIHETVGSKVIFITGSSEPATVSRIALDHPSAVLFKPVAEQQVRDAIAKTTLGLSDASTRALGPI
jgi:DNA-binding NarL/FixJ family response regulator